MIQGHRHDARVPLALLALVTPILVLTLIFCRAGRLNWSLEVAPALVGYVALAATYRRLPLSSFCYVAVFLHTLVLVYGGFYTYAETPLGNWAKEAFHLSRNHYDRVGHFALGFFPVCIIKEVLLRVTPLRRGGWFTFIVLSIVLAIAAVYEFIEWWLDVHLRVRRRAGVPGIAGRSVGRAVGHAARPGRRRGRASSRSARSTIARWRGLALRRLDVRGTLGQSDCLKLLRLGLLVRVATFAIAVLALRGPGLRRRIGRHRNRRQRGWDDRYGRHDRKRGSRPGRQARPARPAWLAPPAPREPWEQPAPRADRHDRRRGDQRHRWHDGRGRERWPRRASRAPPARPAARAAGSRAVGGSGGSGGAGGRGGSTGGGGAGGTGGATTPHGSAAKFICTPGQTYGNPLTGMGTIQQITDPAPDYFAFIEGPIWIGGLGTLFFSDNARQPERIWKLVPPSMTPTVFVMSSLSNGLAVDNNDQIVAAVQSGTNGIARFNPMTGAAGAKITTTGRPNDLIVRSDDNIYFTDPDSGFYRIAPNGTVSAAMKPMSGSRPNGIELSLDENTLYVGDVGNKTITKYTLAADGTVMTMSPFVTTMNGTVDGMCVDCAGNVYAGTSGGVEVYSAAGTYIGTVQTGQSSNCTFGGADRKTLYVTSAKFLKWATLAVPGLPD